MSFGFLNSLTFQQTQAPQDPSAGPEIIITDTGSNNGIEVTICTDASRQIAFETILTDPNSRALLTQGGTETEAFWQCLKHQCWAEHSQVLYITARCHFSPLTIAVTPKRIGRAEARNVRFLRLVEDLLDELRTREPRLSVQLAVTHRDPRFDDYLGDLSAALSGPRA